MLDDLDLLPREVLHERTGALVAESCAWSVGLSDRPHHARRGGRVVPTGVTLGMRAAAGQRLSGDDEQDRLDLADARPGSFADALGALAPDGRLWAERFDDDVLAPFVLATCVLAAERARRLHPRAWADLLDDVGEDGSDLADVVRAAEWEVPLRTDAEQLALAALGDVPLVEVEAEGLPLSVVRAAERLDRPTAAGPPAAVQDLDDLDAALFLAERALQDAALPVPVPASRAADLVAALRAYGVEPAEVLALLPRLPVEPGAAQAVALRLDEEPPEPA